MQGKMKEEEEFWLASSTQDDSDDHDLENKDPNIEDG